jgi:hypothetical protein
MVNQEWNMSIDQAIESDAQTQAICMQTHDFVRAFMKLLLRKINQSLKETDVRSQFFELAIF